MLDIHVGIMRDDLKTFARVMKRQFSDPAHMHLSTMEDKWEEWTEYWPESEMDGDDVIHILISTDLPLRVLQFLAGLQFLLNPITDEADALIGKFIVVTDHDQWEQVYIELCLPE